MEMFKSPRNCKLSTIPLMLYSFPPATPASVFNNFRSNITSSSRIFPRFNHTWTICHWQLVALAGALFPMYSSFPQSSSSHKSTVPKWTLWFRPARAGIKPFLFKPSTPHTPTGTRHITSTTMAGEPPNGHCSATPIWTTTYRWSSAARHYRTSKSTIESSTCSTFSLVGIHRSNSSIAFHSAALAASPTMAKASKSLQPGTARFHTDASPIATTWSVSNRTTQLSSPTDGTISLPTCPQLIKLQFNLLPTTSLTLSMAQSHPEDPTNKSLKWLLKSKIVRQRFLGVHQM